MQFPDHSRPLETFWARDLGRWGILDSAAVVDRGQQRAISLTRRIRQSVLGTCKSTLWREDAGLKKQVEVLASGVVESGMGSEASSGGTGGSAQRA